MNQQTTPKPSPRGKDLPIRYKLDDERAGITRRVEIYTEMVDEEGQLIRDEKGYPKIFTIKLYFTIGCYEDGVPGEIFVDLSKEGHMLHGWADSWATLMSLLLQYGVHPRDLIYRFKGTSFIPCGITNMPEVPICKSIPDLLVRYLEWKYFSEDEDNDDGYESVLDAAIGTEEEKKEEE